MGKITPKTRKVDLPAELTAGEILELENDKFYPAYFYNSLHGITKKSLIIEDFERGIIDPRQIKIKGMYKLGQKRTTGQKTMMCITGLELKRIAREGRQVGYFSAKLERLAS